MFSTIVNADSPGLAAHAAPEREVELELKLRSTLTVTVAVEADEALSSASKQVNVTTYTSSGHHNGQ